VLGRAVRKVDGRNFHNEYLADILGSNDCCTNGQGQQCLPFHAIMQAPKLNAPEMLKLECTEGVIQIQPLADIVLGREAGVHTEETQSKVLQLP